MEIENFTAFLVTALIFVMTPGLDTVFVLNKAIGQGVKSGVYSTLGVNSGVILHTMFAALGLSVLVSKSDMAFTLIKYIGAVYLVYLGIVNLTVKRNSMDVKGGEMSKSGDKSAFLSGFITNALNPKVALFFLAFFPQFISPDQIENPLPFIILGLTYAVIGTVWYLMLTFFTATFSRKFKENPNIGRGLAKLSGLVFVLMGLKIAFL